MAWIELEGAVNVRDLGGLPTRDGGRTVPARLLRADNLQELSAADVARLVGDIGVTTVVDLRSIHERASEGPAPLDSVPAVRHAHHPVLPELGAATDVVADALLTRSDQDKSRYPDDPTCGHYLGYLEDRPEAVVAALRAIARSEGAAVVHCAAGKDRTGVVVALALTAVGVWSQDVVADYAATADRTEAILARLRRSPTYARDIDSKPADSHRARPETMAAFLEQMDTRYGGVAQWLSDHGFTDDDLRLLRAKLCRPTALMASPEGRRKLSTWFITDACPQRSGCLPFGLASHHSDLSSQDVAPWSRPGTVVVGGNFASKARYCGRGRDRRGPAAHRGLRFLGLQ